VTTVTLDTSLETIQTLMSLFEAKKVSHKGRDSWHGRDLMDLFACPSWQTFKGAVKRAAKAIVITGMPVEAHVEFYDDVILWGGGAKGRKSNCLLSRHGAYMLIQELRIADSTLAAFAKTYFSGQTQVAETIQSEMKNMGVRVTERAKLRATEKSFNETLWDHGVKSGSGIAKIRSQGDKALLGAPTRVCKERLGMNVKKPLADNSHTIVITAKLLSAQMTTLNAEEQNLQGPLRLEKEHVDNNLAVRGMLVGRGIVPENLPPGEDTVKLERQLATRGGSSTGSRRRSSVGHSVAPEKADPKRFEQPPLFPVSE